MLFSHWIEDTLTVIDGLNGPVILVGSGKGAWISLLAAQSLPVKILSCLNESLFALKLMKSLSTDDVEMVYRKDSLCETDGEVCLGQLNRLIMDKPVMNEDDAVDLLCGLVA